MQPGWLASGFQGSISFCLSTTVIIDVLATMCGFYMGAGDLQSGPNACNYSTNEPSPTAPKVKILR